MTRNGGRGTRLSQIAQEAGVITAGLLHHFESNEQLLHAVLDARDADDMAYVDMTGDVIEQLERVTDRFERAPSRWQDWPERELSDRKRDLGVTVSVVIPARNEERTVAGVVSAIARLAADTGLIDEVVVMDSDSTDATAAVAAQAGAAVFGPGKWRPNSAAGRARARRCGSRCLSPRAICSCS
jgi:AcrR family transcriptional regulator